MGWIVCVVDPQLHTVDTAVDGPAFFFMKRQILLAA
jgi:hypothetical protein